jgi:hypothetical protein
MFRRVSNLGSTEIAIIFGCLGGSVGQLGLENCWVSQEYQEPTGRPSVNLKPALPRLSLGVVGGQGVRYCCLHASPREASLLPPYLPSKGMLAVHFVASIHLGTGPEPHPALSCFTQTIASYKCKILFWAPPEASHCSVSSGRRSCLFSICGFITYLCRGTCSSTTVCRLESEGGH